MKRIELLFSIASIHTMANSQSRPESAADFQDFKNLLLEVGKFRQPRLISLDSFLFSEQRSEHNYFGTGQVAEI